MQFGDAPKPPSSAIFVTIAIKEKQQTKHTPPTQNTKKAAVDVKKKQYKKAPFTEVSRTILQDKLMTPGQTKPDLIDNEHLK